MTKKSTLSQISIHGAREHNLKGISLDIPRDKFVVVTGVSGSGKTSLVFDTLLAECRRTFLESLSGEYRQELGTTTRPDVDQITGISPAIGFEQSRSTKRQKYTVATVTEIQDYLGVLYARLGQIYCPSCQGQIVKHSAQSIANLISTRSPGTKVYILAPVVCSAEDNLRRLEDFRLKGFTRYRFEGEIYDIQTELAGMTEFEIVVDRLIVKSQMGNRVTDSLELALSEGKGRVLILEEDESGNTSERYFTDNFICPSCHLLFPNVEPNLFSYFSPHGRCLTCRGQGRFEEVVCQACRGTRLCEAANQVRISNASLGEISNLPIVELMDWFDSLEFTDSEMLVSAPLIREIKTRLSFLNNVGVGYLSLDRAETSLSRGELQRIRLASQLGSPLQGVIYVIDEPSVGLHPKDTESLVSTLCALRDKGNSIIVVEHDSQIIEQADWIIEMGPGAGEKGGQILLQGSAREVLSNSASISRKVVSNTELKRIEKERRKLGRESIELRGASKNNLKNIAVEFPLGGFICVTGVSGSGKSSLVNQTLLPALQCCTAKKSIADIQHLVGIAGYEKVAKVVAAEASGGGNSLRSNPATYSGVMVFIRELFSSLPEARARGYSSSRFSFNVKGGRCEHCHGYGTIRVEMMVMSDVYVKCPECQGQRFNNETLAVKYRGQSIADVLESSVFDAHALFQHIPNIETKLRALIEVGLGYLMLGQNSSSLSGGEHQRMVLANEISKAASSHTVYLFDEPTAGLHYEDIDLLISIFQRLVDQGNTVVAIEHNPDLILAADWCIDLGPGAGSEGGEIVAVGSPEQLIKTDKSVTGQYLKRHRQSLTIR